MSELIKLVEESMVEKPANLPDFKSGDTLNIHLKIKEGNKERVQQFKGTVIQRKNQGTASETFTIRKLSGGIGVERIIPLNSPAIEKVEVLSKGQVRRSRIYYLRGRAGKAAKIKERK